MRRIGGLVILLLSVSTSAAYANADGLPPGLALREEPQGLVLADSGGAPLYQLDIDRWKQRREGLNEVINGRCAQVCERAWIPVEPPKAFKPAGDWSIQTGWSGVRQLAYKGQPLYRFAGKSLDELAHAKVAPPHWSSYSAQPTALADGVPVATKYWHAALFQPPPPKLEAPASVAVQWSKTAYHFIDSDKSDLYTRKSGSSCTGGCDGFEPFAAPLAVQPIGAWRPVETKDGARVWSFRGKLVYRAGTGSSNGPGSEWSLLEIR